MTICTVAGTYLANYSCQTLGLKVTITFEGQGNLTLGSPVNTPCGQTYTVAVNGTVQSVYVQVTSGNANSGNTDANTFSNYQWLGVPSMSCASDEKYDCINGACIPKTTYDTPGLYQSLEDCEVACGTGCSGKCISNSEWAQIEGLSNELKSTTCS